MTVLTAASSFDDVYQLETTDPVTGGPGGVANRQAQALLNRTLFLKNAIAQAATLASFASSNSASGYQKLPSGLILQWGANAAGADSTGTLVSFPIAFPNSCLIVAGSDSGTVCAAAGCTILSASQFRLYGRDNTGAYGTYSIQWIAIGY